MSRLVTPPEPPVEVPALPAGTSMPGLEVRATVCAGLGARGTALTAGVGETVDVEDGDAVGDAVVGAADAGPARARPAPDAMSAPAPAAVAR
jgi:hypothetical protein